MSDPSCRLTQSYHRERKVRSTQEENRIGKLLKNFSHLFENQGVGPSFNHSTYIPLLTTTIMKGWSNLK